jgi:DNA-binding Lrp family transcriptional regulator
MRDFLRGSPVPSSGAGTEASILLLPPDRKAEYLPVDKAEKKALDRLDLKILDVLQADGRITIQTLSERVALSPSACLARVRHLEASGVICGYQARIALDLIRSTLALYAEVTLSRHNPEAFRRFETAIAAMPEIVEAAQVSGAFDYLLKVIVPDIQTWRELAARLQADTGVEKVTSLILLKPAKVFEGVPLA